MDILSQNKEDETSFNKILISLFIYKQLCDNGNINILENESFDDWIELGSDFSVSNVSDAIHGLLRLNPSMSEELKNSFNTFLTERSKLLGSEIIQTKIFTNIIYNIKDLDNSSSIEELKDTYYKPSIDYFCDKLSLNAFLYAVSQARKMQNKLNKAKRDTIVMYDGEIITNPSFEVFYSLPNLSVVIQTSDNFSYSLCGSTTDEDGKIYARKNEVVEAFKRISFYKKY